MGPTVINGLPAHVLLVHAVVVLVPLSALLVIAAVVWPAARRRLGVLTPLLAMVTLILIPITTHAGEWLLHTRSQVPAVLAKHADLGDQLVYWSAWVFVMSAVWWALHTSWSRKADDRILLARVMHSTLGQAIVGVLSFVAAIGSVIMVYRIGDTGAHAVWGNQPLRSTR